MTTLFQKRHYEAVAQALQRCQLETVWSPEATEGFIRVQMALITLFRHDNGHFYTDRFERACQPGANVSARAERFQGAPNE